MEKHNKLIKELTKLAKAYEIQVEFVYDEDAHLCGQAFMTKSLIRLNVATFYTRSYALGTFFHELGHIIAYRNKKWAAYHNVADGRITKDKFKKWKRSQLKAEQYIDSWAERELKKYDARCKYLHTYKNEIVKKDIKDFQKYFTFQDFKTFMRNYTK